MEIYLFMQQPSKATAAEAVKAALVKKSFQIVQMETKDLFVCIQYEVERRDPKMGALCLDLNEME